MKSYWLAGRRNSESTLCNTLLFYRERDEQRLQQMYRSVCWLSVIESVIYEVTDDGSGNTTIAVIATIIAGGGGGGGGGASR